MFIGLSAPLFVEPILLREIQFLHPIPNVQSLPIANEKFNEHPCPYHIWPIHLGPSCPAPKLAELLHSPRYRVAMRWSPTPIVFLTIKEKHQYHLSTVKTEEPFGLLQYALIIYFVNCPTY